MKVKIYSTTWCAFCRAEKKYLDEQHVEYTAVDVEADQIAAQEMVHLTGQMGVPVTTITHDDGRLVAIVGFDREHLDTELGLTKK